MMWHGCKLAVIGGGNNGGSNIYMSLFSLVCFHRLSVSEDIISTHLFGVSLLAVSHKRVRM